MADPSIIGALSLAAIFALILLGFHIGVALAAVSFAGVYLISGRFSVAASLLETTSYNALADYTLAVIPLFVVMGLFATQAGATRDLFSAFERLLHRVQGGVGVATVFSNAVFAAITGVSVASAAVFSKLAGPELDRLGYERRFGLGIIASSSVLGMLIPPSILMIVYAVIAEQSVGRLFAAGIGPGILVAAALSLSILWRVRRRPALVGGVEADGVEGGGAAGVILRTWPIFALIALVLGGIYAGLFTPTEAGAVGALGAIVLIVLRGRFGWSALLGILIETGQACASIFLLLITAQMYSRMLTLSRLPDALMSWVTGLEISGGFVILAFIVVLILLGCIIDSVSILLLTTPIMAPIAGNLGYDPIWFGMVAIVAIELGLLTPPFGMVVFAMKASLPPSVRIEEIFAGVAPFLLVLLLALALIALVPPLTLAIPRAIFG